MSSMFERVSLTEDPGWKALEEELQNPEYYCADCELSGQGENCWNCGEVPGIASSTPDEMSSDAVTAVYFDLPRVEVFRPDL